MKHARKAPGQSFINYLGPVTFNNWIPHLHNKKQVYQQKLDEKRKYNIFFFLNLRRRRRSKGNWSLEGLHDQ